jgi:hypothetical protein
MKGPSVENRVPTNEFVVALYFEIETLAFAILKGALEIHELEFRSVTEVRVEDREHLFPSFTQ